MKKLLLYMGTPLVLAACSLAPEYERPGMPVDDQFPAAEAMEKQAQKMAYQIGWKEYFKDPRLHRYIELALDNNRDLKTALLNTEAARLAYGIQKSERLPGINASGAKSRSKSGENPNGQSVINSGYNVNAGISQFELDFFGRVKSMTDAQLNTYLATYEGQKAAQIALISQIARSYAEQVLAEEQLALARNTLRSNQASYNLVKQQVEAGIANNLDLAQSLGQVHSANVQVAVYERSLAVANNALYELVGVKATNLPKGLSVRDSFLIGVPAGLPSEVLLLRPDVMAAEYQLRAANANIGAARAAFFPSISLTATVGSSSQHFDDLFSSATSGWNFTPSLTMPIFNWGKIQSNLDLAYVRQNSAVVNYEKTIQTAFREVADGLVSLKPLEKQLLAQKNLVNTTAEQLNLAETLYNNGIANYLDVLDAQRSLFSARQALLTTYHQKILNGIALYAALGGGLVKEAGEEYIPELQIKK